MQEVPSLEEKYRTSRAEDLNDVHIIFLEALHTKGGFPTAADPRIVAAGFHPA
jgi:hypothetical protein